MPPDRRNALAAQSVVTGIDFVFVAADQINLDVFFLTDPLALAAPLNDLVASQVRIHAEGLEDVPVAAISLAVFDGRNVVHVVTTIPGGFAPYRLFIDDPRIDPFFNDVSLSFKANCPSPFDCEPPPHECPPESAVDFPVETLARDWASFRRALLDFASQRYPDWQDRLEADVGCPTGSNGNSASTCTALIAIITYRDPVPNTFSFNSPLGACEVCQGFGRTIDIDLDLIIPDPRKTIEDNAVKPWSTPATRSERHQLLKFCAAEGIPTDVPFAQLSDTQQRYIIDGHKRFEGIRGWFRWLETKTYRMHIRIFLAKYRSYVPCTSCHGTRLKPESLLTRIGGKNIAQLYAMSVGENERFFRELAEMHAGDRAIDLILGEICSRLKYLVDVGLDYLTLDRQSRTLSGGEVQRVNLTTAMGSSLVNTLYILDEPSIGLHPRDSRRLVQILHNLKQNQNTIVVVEHDPEMIRESDRILDLGPGAGERGGEVVYFGAPAGILQRKTSLTGQYLSGKRVIPVPTSRRQRVTDYAIDIRGATQNNLKDIDVTIPLGLLVCVTGVSGSGKSTLIHDVLYNTLQKARGMAVGTPGACQSIRGGDLVDEVVMVDQSPIGRTPRANPVTYVKAYDDIRRLFAATEAAAERSFRASTFSFNAAGGRCETCQGSGFEKVEMQFLSDIFVTCPECDGARFRQEVLEVTYRDKTIADVLQLTVAEALIFFHEYPAITAALQPLEEVGLDYIRLGQPLNTLSGGESQRLKLASHMTLRDGKTRLLIFDEPTTGLHFEDIRKLLRAFERLLEQGHSLVVIEHNLEVIKSADYLIDLGPEGGEAGGELVVCGTPEEVSHVRRRTPASFCATISTRTPKRFIAWRIRICRQGCRKSITIALRLMAPGTTISKISTSTFRAINSW